MLDGFRENSSAEPEAWASVKISLSTATRAEGWRRSASANPEAGFSYVYGESAWVELTPQARQALREKLHVNLGPLIKK
jgi:hypothetical protein